MNNDQKGVSSADTSFQVIVRYGDKVIMKILNLNGSVNSGVEYSLTEHEKYHPSLLPNSHNFNQKIRYFRCVK